jgi:hypothetical protein
MPRSKWRTRLFTLIPALVFLFLFLRLLGLAQDLWKSADPTAYALNEGINARNRLIASKNPYGFTDKVWPRQKRKGVYRIAVIGDSFIWGDGLPYQHTWGHKLAEKIESDSVEVLNWGKCGWSTLDEFNFFKQYGKDYNIDLLIIGWVDNDPDIGKIPQVPAGNPKEKFPITYKIFPALAKSWLNASNGDYYSNWMDKIYKPENLKGYQAVLDSFYTYLSERGTKSFVVMTPSVGNFGYENKCFVIASTMLKKAGFDCLNLLPETEKIHGNAIPDSLTANGANGHPGEILTEEYANETMAYLKARSTN